VGSMPANRERTYLRRSLAATGGLALLAVAWGWLAGSQVILLDGAYAVIGMALTWMSLWASRLAESRPSARYPYGREALVPLAIALQGFALLATLGYAGVEAVRVILGGGGEVAAGALLAYGVVSGVISLVLWLLLARADSTSDLLLAEARQWAAATVFSLIVAAGAVAALVLRRLGYGAIEPYVDSVLVLVGCALLLPQPITLLRAALRELLEGAPTTDVQQPVQAGVDAVRHRHRLGDPSVRMSKVGRKLYVDVVFLVEAGRWAVDQEDVVRREMAAELAGLPYELWLSVELTTDPGRAGSLT